METELIYGTTSALLIGIGLYAVVVRRHMIRRLMAVNVLGSGVFVLFAAFAARGPVGDPVPHAMVLTGIVVAVSATALGLVLTRRLYAMTGSTRLTPPDGDDDGGEKSQ